MVKTAPLVSASLLGADPLDMGADAERVLAEGADWLHVDVMDGHFVPNLSFGIPFLKALRGRLPNAFLDTHLMISNPAAMVANYAQAGADLVSFHCELDDEEISRSFAALSGSFPETKIGLAINPDSQLSRLEPWLMQVDLVLVMSVQPGFGGQAFKEESIQRVSDLRRMLEKLPASKRPIIQVDGGVSSHNAAALSDAGAGCLVAGSFLFSGGGIASRVASLKSL